jgi:murein DD-endopeptidase MepM/ murein hydrolase activator NlpD
MVLLDIDPPPSARRPDAPPRGRALALATVALLVGLGGGFLLGRWSVRAGVGVRGATAGTAGTAVPGTAGAAGTAVPTPTAVPGTGGGADGAAVPAAVPGMAPAAPGAVPGTTAAVTLVPPATTGAAPTTAALAPAGSASVATPAPAAPPSLSGPRRLSVTLQGALEDSIAQALPREERARAPELTAVVNRILVWDLHVAKDGRRGDRLDVLWAPAAPVAPGMAAQAEPVVLALRYASGKLGGVLAAYRFEPKGARFARYYRADGQEVETRLVDAPVADYEQVTSLLKDGRRHKGVDFKTPAGSPVVAPFDGVVERRNWHFSANGNCLDLRDPATGRHAIFLHLDVVPKEMGVGRTVRKGEVIAQSGNSGHSFAPHLHYQLEDASGKVLDPFAVLKTERRSLSAADRSAFEAERARLDRALGG